jgi:hypothetical protein
MEKSMILNEKWEVDIKIMGIHILRRMIQLQNCVHQLLGKPI